MPLSDFPAMLYSKTCPWSITDIDLRDMGHSVHSRNVRVNIGAELASELPCI